MKSENLNMQLLNKPLIYRSILTIPKKINFGLEFELDKVDYEKVYNVIKKHFGDNWIVKEEKELTKNNSAEIVSPILKNEKHTWIILKEMSKIIESFNPSYDICSFQVNFDGDLLPTIKDRVKFLKLFAVYEDIIYRFSMGDDDSYRESIEMYASPIILCLKGVLGNDNAIIDFFSDQKRYGVALKKEKDLIEFRTPNGTSNPILWQNYITAFFYILKYSLNKKCNEKELDEYIKKFYKAYMMEYYQNYHEEKAIEFADKIFKKQKDKIYFLNQYSQNYLN